ncbi:hypothetical protein GCM10011349_46490 [Novosphingobium indicum]|uniref:Uncharacterized protein n=1 Tax=Novosphingobium indicum TaxID=462949 RepID=A0ABQ2K379_9SPHN|nr:hypothetical protein [Novosphingobium indicum]GGN62652.1 hypothetical protein GCM10011349_46490 [Novosphingobium indicum]
MIIDSADTKKMESISTKTHHDEWPIEEYRYISHVEDDPMVFQRYFNKLQEAVDATCMLIVDRMELNGAGDGVVYDRLDRRIVACLEGVGENGGGTTAVEINHIPAPDHLQRCARVVENRASAEISSV